MPSTALRVKATRCRRLAGSLDDPPGKAALEWMARDLDEKADAIEAQKPVMADDEDHK